VRGKNISTNIYSTYGQVFKARNRATGKIVAIKKFKESDHEDQHVRALCHKKISYYFL
jgi:serine/threonine protein kinase